MGKYTGMTQSGWCTDEFQDIIAYPEWLQRCIHQHLGTQATSANGTDMMSISPITCVQASD